ncbi:hypothetical protein ASG17_12610 [Brevundimonas sp. Leaf363]|nr:hypothetical protein ASG17_12610 [Brevundimonas sp. Leaf363]
MLIDLNDFSSLVEDGFKRIDDKRVAMALAVMLKSHVSERYDLLKQFVAYRQVSLEASSCT